MNNWIEQATEEAKHTENILSFHDYMDLLDKHFVRECRPTFAWLKDMFNHFGKDEHGHYKLFREYHIDALPVYGQYQAEHALVQNLLNFEEEGYNNKFLLLVGPNGSAKSSIVKKIMKGAEEYSLTEEGALYTFSWVFPVDNLVKGSLGLADNRSQSDFRSFAYLEDKDITAILGSELKDHPLLLIPLDYRREMIDKNLQDNPRLLNSIKKSYLYNGDLSKRNRMIFDSLLKNYKGSYEEVMRHVRVERFNISQRYSISAVTIEPQIHTDAKLQQITMDKRLASLPPSLQSLNLFSLTGETISANRGILEFSDLLKRPLDTYKYLLMTVETKNINLQGILTELDLFLLGTSNEVHLTAFKQHPDFNSFKGRFNFIRVPYLLDVENEIKIYQMQVESLKKHATYEPHAIFSLCLFAIMSRLRPPQAKNYSNKVLGNIIIGLNPLEKALFLSNGKVPERLETESKQLLENHKKEIQNEFANDPLYEGKFGLSPREIKKIIYKLVREHKAVTFIEVIEQLRQFISKKGEHDFLDIPPQADYHHPLRFIHLIKEHCLKVFDKELRDSLGMIDDRSYEDHIKKYIANINALIKGEKIKNAITGRFENPDTYFIKEFESTILLKEDENKFRSHILSSVGAYSLDNPGKDIVYTKVFPDLAQKLKESFRQEQKKTIETLARHLIFFDSDSDQSIKNGLSLADHKFVSDIIKHLKNQYHYSETGVLTILKYVIKEKY